ncbi:MAG: hypothetical protein JOY78_13815 [Pseudonocardia sp.]|nr:hypothetical protein [Pseudonocardia sp.]
MARPETIEDIEINRTEFGSIDVNKIANDGTLLKAYAIFLESVQKAGGEVELRYGSSATFTRAPSPKEQFDQLRAAQREWDVAKKYYEQIAAVGDTEHSYQRREAEVWAEKEGLPFPPEHEPIESVDTVIDNIDAVLVP